MFKDSIVIFGTLIVASFFPPEVHDAIRALATEIGTGAVELISDSIDAIFVADENSNPVTPGVK